jgi:hypothetical protein
MSHDDRDPDEARDAWTCDEIATIGLSRPPVAHAMPPAIVAAEERRLAEARAARIEPTPEERQARNEAGMDRLRASAGLQFFHNSRRR